MISSGTVTRLGIEQAAFHFAFACNLLDFNGLLLEGVCGRLHRRVENNPADREVRSRSA